MANKGKSPQRARGGRPTKYEPKVHVPLARGLARAGLTAPEMAAEMGIAERTLYKWRGEHPEFMQALNEGRELADFVVEDALYQRARGYRVKEVRREVTASGERRTELVRDVPPDTTAAIFWLKNRKPAQWRDRRDGRDGGAPQAPAAPAPDFGLLLAPPFLSIHRAVAAGAVTDVWEAGGRGSTKSSSISLEICEILRRDPDANALVMQRWGTDIRNGTFAQVAWALDRLGMAGDWEQASSARRIRNRETGQLVLFRGGDDPRKLKGVKFERGRCAALWLEEADQFGGMADVRAIRQSATRGEGHQVRFYSFNPPQSAESWANVEFDRVAALGDPAQVAHRSTYLEVPREWLGEQFLADAEGLREADETAYRHEYLGEAVGTGGDVFPRAVYEPIPDGRIASFDRLYAGQDWGWWPDPWAFTLSAWEPGTRTLYTFRELGGTRLQPGESAEMVRRALTWPERDASGAERPTYHALPVLSDDSDPGHIAAHRDAGVEARAAGKGGNRMRSYAWLASVRWVIDPARCPNLAREARAKQHDRTRDGEWASSVPDGDDHWIDATRYAMMPVVTHRGAYGTDRGNTRQGAV